MATTANSPPFTSASFRLASATNLLAARGKARRRRPRTRVARSAGPLAAPPRWQWRRPGGYRARPGTPRRPASFCAQPWTMLTTITKLSLTSDVTWLEVPFTPHAIGLSTDTEAAIPIFVAANWTVHKTFSLLRHSRVKAPALSRPISLFLVPPSFITPSLSLFAFRSHQVGGATAQAALYFYAFRGSLSGRFGAR